MEEHRDSPDIHQVLLMNAGVDTDVGLCLIVASFVRITTLSSKSLSTVKSNFKIIKLYSLLNTTIDLP